MSFVTRRPRRAFTVVEIVIVVIVLGTLAAVVIPQFTRASSSARQSNLQSQLQTLRSQIECYHLDYKAWPDLTTWTPLTGVGTGANGTPLGPYMLQAPSNALVNRAAVAVGNGALGKATAEDGWVYDKSTGEIHAVTAAGVPTDDGN